MRKITVTGHLGADPEMKSTRNGVNYVSFRIGNNEYSDDTTYWFSVSVWDTTLQNFCLKNLKKGSGVAIYGHYNDRLYTNPKTNQPEISRDILAKDIDFYSIGKKENGGNTQSQYQQPLQPQAQPNIQQNNIDLHRLGNVDMVVESTSTNSQSFSTNNYNDDDLPF